MRATNWEFANRALVFGLIFAFAFPLYFLDHQNSTAALASWLGARLQTDAELVAQMPRVTPTCPRILRLLALRTTYQRRTSTSFEPETPSISPMSFKS